MGIFEKIAVAAALAAAILVPTLHRQVEKSKVTSADVSAKEVIQTVNSWIADDIYLAGGDEKYACEIRIEMNNGNATVIERSGKNNWSGTGGFRSLGQRLEWDYDTRTFTATVFVDNSGYAVYSWFVPDDANYSGAAPARADFEAGVYDGWKKEGTTDDGVTIGTCPRLISGADER